MNKPPDADREAARLSLVERVIDAVPAPNSFRDAADAADQVAQEMLEGERADDAATRSARERTLAERQAANLARILAKRDIAAREAAERRLEAEQRLAAAMRERIEAENQAEHELRLRIDAERQLADHREHADAAPATVIALDTPPLAQTAARPATAPRSPALVFGLPLLALIAGFALGRVDQPTPSGEGPAAAAPALPAPAPALVPQRAAPVAGEPPGGDSEPALRLDAGMPRAVAEAPGGGR